MPIRAEHRWLYPIDWQQLSAVIRFERAEGRCEHCGRPHAGLVCHLGDGRWWDEGPGAWRDGRGRLVKSVLPPPSEGTAKTRVYLATAHLDHDPSNSHRATWRHFVSAVTCFMTGPSICGGGGSPCACARQSEICFWASMGTERQRRRAAFGELVLPCRRSAPRHKIVDAPRGCGDVRQVLELSARQRARSERVRA